MYHAAASHADIYMKYVLACTVLEYQSSYLGTPMVFLIVWFSSMPHLMLLVSGTQRYRICNLQDGPNGLGLRRTTMLF